jgi:hypothetical protein
MLAISNTLTFLLIQHRTGSQALDRPTVAPRRVGGQLLTAPEDRLGQAVAYLVFAELRRRGQRTLIGDDVTDNVHGQRRIAKGQKWLPVQPASVTLVHVCVAGRAGRDEGTNRTVLTGSQHGSSAHLGGIVGRQAPSTTEVRSGYLTLARAHGSAGGGAESSLQARPPS